MEQFKNKIYLNNSTFLDKNMKAPFGSSLLSLLFVCLLVYLSVREQCVIRTEIRKL